MSEKKEKGWIKRHWFLSIVFGIIGLFIFLVILGMIVSISNNTPNKTNNTQTSNEQGINDAENNPPQNEPNNSPLNIIEENKSNTASDNYVNYPCIELSTLELLDYNPAFQSWFAKITPYKSGNKEIIYDFFINVDGEDLIACEEGSEEGQNSNWVYCGDDLRPIFLQYTDEDNTILKKRSVQVTFDKNTKQYLSTKCDAYEFF